MEEIWRDIKGYEGKYQISNTGKVKSLERTVWDSRGCYRTVPERILKAQDNGVGYLYIVLCKNGKGKLFYVHRLVGQAFIENPEGYTELNHKDENKQNNCMENLEWCSRSYNLSYNERAKKAGKKAGKKVAEKLKGRKLPEEQIKKMSKPVIGINKVNGLIVEFPSTKEAERQTGIPHQNIGKCCNGKGYKSAGGYYWIYSDSEEVDHE